MSTVGPTTCWLHCPSGVAVRVTGRGLMMGRRHDSDVVLQDTRASQHHALLTVSLDGPELLIMGKNPTQVNGSTRRGRVALSDGAVLEMPGGRFTVEVRGGSEWSDQAWWLEFADGSRFGLRTLPFGVGGGPEDQLRIDGWPPGALIFHAARGALTMELGADGALNDNEAGAGTTELVENWDRVSFGEVGVTLRSGGASERTSTVMAGKAPGPTWVRFTFLANGGRLEVDMDDGVGVTRLELAELRARLLAALLRPKGEYEAGDAIPDEMLVPAIWPGMSNRGRVDLNVLIHRTRNDLVRAGLNPATIIERARKGGSTRFVLAPDARITVA